MICPKCRNNSDDDSQICLHCGYFLAPQAVHPTDTSKVVSIDNSKDELTDTSKVVSIDKLMDDSIDNIVDGLSNDSFEDINSITPEIPPLNLTTNQVNNVPKKNTRVIILSSIIAVLLLFSTAGYVFFLTDLFKTPKQIYMLAESTTVKNLYEEFNVKSTEYYNNEINPIFNNPYESKINVSDIKLQGIPELSPTIENLITSIKINSVSQSDMKNNLSFTNFKLFVKDNELLKFDIYQNKNLLTFSFPLLFKKNIQLEMDKLKQLVGNYAGPEAAKSLPTKVIQTQDIINALKYDEKATLTSLINYGLIYFDNIKEENVTLEKNVPYKAGKEDITCKKLTIKLSPSDLDKIANKSIDTAIEDSNLYNLTLGNISRVTKLYKDAGYDVSEIQLTDLTKESYKKGLKDLKEEMKKNPVSKETPNGLKMTLWLDGKNIIGRDIEIESKDELNKLDVFNIVYNSSVKKSSLPYSKVSLISTKELDVGKNKTTFDITNSTIENTKTSEKGKLAVQIKNGLIDKEVVMALANIDYTKTPGVDAETTLYTYKTTITSESELFKENVLLFNVGIKSSEKKKTEQRSLETTINLQLTPNNMSFGMKINNELTKIAKVVIPTFNAENSINISNASNTEIDSLKDQAILNLQAFALQNGELLKIFMPQMVPTMELNNVQSSTTIQAIATKPKVSPSSPPKKIIKPTPKATTKPTIKLPAVKVPVPIKATTKPK